MCDLHVLTLHEIRLLLIFFFCHSYSFGFWVYLGTSCRNFQPVKWSHVVDLIQRFKFNAVIDAKFV